MKINGWSIDGFGIFHDYTVRGLGDSLTIFYGPNEAGKSTLLAFLRGVLFGFPDGRSTEPRYPALRGGRPGGRVFVQAKDGEWMVDRQVGRRPALRLTRPDGQAGEDGDLRQIVGGADDRLFRMVFAFSLGELQSFDTLGADGIRERIFSAGIAGAARPAREAIRELDARASILLKSRGQGRVNLLLAELIALDERIDAARQAAQGFQALLAVEEQRADEVERLGREIDVVRDEKARVLQLADLSPLGQRLQERQTDLDGMEAAAPIGPDTDARLTAVLHNIQMASQTRRQLLDERQAADRRRADIRTDDRLPSLAGMAEALFEGLSLHRDLLQQLPAARTRRQVAIQRLNERLRALGPTWDEGRLQPFDRSIPRHDVVRAYEGRLGDAAAGVNRAAQALALAVRRRDELQQSLARQTLPEGEPPPSAEALALQMKAVRTLRTSVGELRAAELERTTQDALVRDRERSIRLLEAELTPDGHTWMATAAFLVTLLAAATILVPRVGDATWVALFIGAVLTAAITIYTWLRQRRSAAARALRQRDMDAVLVERDTALDARDAEARRVAALARSIAADAATLGLEGPPTMQHVEEREAHFLNQLADRQAIDDMRERIAGVQEALAVTQSEVDRSAEAEDQARAAEAVAREEWTRWKRDLDLPDHLSPQGALDVFDGVRVAQEALLARDTAAREVEEIVARIGAWERRAGETLTAAGRDADAQSERLIDQLVSLRQQIADDREARRTLDGIDADVADRSARVAFLDESLARLLAERDGIFAAAGATDESSYRQRADVAVRRVALLDQIRDLEQQIDERIGGADGDAIREALATASEDHWRQASEALEGRIDDLQRQRDESIARHRDAVRERVTVESSADVARLETEFEGLRTELQSVVRDWQATSLASMLLEETLHQFERTRQPEVLATASTTFAYITKGRYVRVVQEEEGNGILVIDRDGGRRPAESLSRGTAEQLYLCIRFALAAEFGRRSEPLPIVMDDVFVNFDAERAESMGYVIAEFAQNHQVLLFTCHPATRDMLTRIVPAARVVELAQVEPAGLPSQARPVRLSAEPEPAPVAPAPRDTATFDLLEGVPPLGEREN